VAASLWRKGATRRFPDELRWLGLGATLALALTVLAPGLSVEYGVLRAFQQALLILAPATAAGCALLMRPLRRSGHRLAAVVAVAAFTVLTGLVGQALGGSSPQLHVADTGLYYDLYYRTPQDAAGIAWLDGVLDQRVPGRRSPSVSSDLPTIGSIAIHRRSYDGLDDQVFPPLLKRDATVFLDTTTVRDDRSAISYGGDVVPYRYPIGLLERTKSRVYDNGSARVYR
jgi:hypothetical protein